MTPPPRSASVLWKGALVVAFSKEDCAVLSGLESTSIRLDRGTLAVLASGQDVPIVPDMVEGNLSSVMKMGKVDLHI